MSEWPLSITLLNMGSGSDTQSASLRRMKLCASGLVLLMAALLILLQGMTQPWVAPTLAFVEAALVGALADWFAVTALFRHPLGIPFPHSAILAANKKRIGENLGVFVRDNFLDQAVLRSKLSSIDLNARAVKWLENAENRELLLARIARALPIIIESVADDVMFKMVEKGVRAELRKVDIAPFVGRFLGLLTEQGQHQRLIDELLNIASEIVDQNRESLRAKIGQETPWFLPSFVDNKIYQKIVSQIEQSLDDIGRDLHHPLRRQIANSISGFVENLKNSERYSEIAELLKNELLNNKGLSDALYSSLVSIKDRSISELGQAGSQVRHYLDQILVRVAALIREDEQLHAAINSWLTNALTRLADSYRESASKFIAETVNGWETQTMVDKFELEIGRDLQFIRINGTIVGGLVGLGIYLIKIL